MPGEGCKQGFLEQDMTTGSENRDCTAKKSADSGRGNSKERKKVGLALGSGGARGFCHIGVLQVFKENNIPIDFMSGCSMGAVVGGCYCAGVDLDKMRRLAAKLTNLQILDFNISFKRQGFLKSGRAISIIKRLIGDKKYEDCDIPFASTCVDALTGELITTVSGDLIPWIQASMSIPAAFQAAEIGDRKMLIDGGVMERIPIRQAKELGADIVIAVDALGKPCAGAKINTIADMVERAYLLLDWESSRHKMKEADILITPFQGDRSLYMFKNNNESIDAGRDAASKALPEILSLIYG